jgi:hypothetical protein
LKDNDEDEEVDVDVATSIHKETQQPEEEGSRVDNIPHVT